MLTFGIVFSVWMTAAFQWTFWWFWLIWCLCVLLWWNFISGTSTLAMCTAWQNAHIYYHAAIAMSVVYVYCPVCYAGPSELLLNFTIIISNILWLLISLCIFIFLCFRLQTPVEVSIDFSGGREESNGERSKILWYVHNINIFFLKIYCKSIFLNMAAVVSDSLSCCALLPADLDKVWRSLGTSFDLTLLE